MTEEGKVMLNMRERTIQRKVYGPMDPITGAEEMKKQN
jgi:hypothetical protein